MAVVLLNTCRALGPLWFRQWFMPAPFKDSGDLALFFGAVFSALVVHELGHLLAALGFGFHFLGASFGPLQIQTLHGEWKLSVSKRIFSGSISAIPSSMRHWRGCMLIVIAAGPMFTLVSGLMAVSVGFTNQMFQVAFVQVSVLLFVLGLIPNARQGRTRNDARLFIDLLLRTPGAEEMELYVMLGQLVVEGVRPQDYSADLVARLGAWRGRPESQFVFAQALVRWGLDSEEIAFADKWDLEALAAAEKCDSRIQNAALASSAFFDVVIRRDVESARIKFERVASNELFPRCLAHRTRAAEQVALGRPHRAPAEIIRAQYALPKGIAACALERRLLEQLHMMVLLNDDAQSGARFRTASA